MTHDRIAIIALAVAVALLIVRTVVAQIDRKRITDKVLGLDAWSHHATASMNQNSHNLSAALNKQAERIGSLESWRTWTIEGGNDAPPH